MTNATAAAALRGIADYLDASNNRIEDQVEEKAKVEKPKQTRKPAGNKAPAVKKEEVIKAFQELTKMDGGRAAIDDILEDHLPDKTPLKASNLKPAQYVTVLAATEAVIAEKKANPDPPEDEGFE